MKTEDSALAPGFLRQDEMNALIESETDPITADLMNQAANVVMLRVLRKEKRPIADFDLRYFMEVIQEFASDHDVLRKSLEGEGGQEIWIADDSG